VDSLPYTHSANTATYGNNYSDVPGDDCGTDEAYLEGNDVVYEYTADKNSILFVDLTDLNRPNTAVFVYSDCNDIGDQCEAQGSYNADNSDDHGFQMSVYAGENYYFVVSSADPTESFNYTLKIDS